MRQTTTKKETGLLVDVTLERESDKPEEKPLEANYREEHKITEQSMFFSPNLS